MIRQRALTETVSLIVVTQTGAEDRYGNETEEEAAAVDVLASVEPLATSESEIGEDVRISRYRVLCSPDAAVDGLARVEWRGRSLEVIGEPKLHVSPRGPHHFEFEIREVLGG